MAVLADTNVLIYFARLGQHLPADSFISIITVGEMKAFALRNNWGYRKMTMLNSLLTVTPILAIS
jgi:tRNA(fMet)-specific endonuclease VapC